MRSAASRSRNPGRSARVRASERANRPWPRSRWRWRSASSSAAAGSEPDALERMRYTSLLLALIATAMPTKPARSSSGSGCGEERGHLRPFLQRQRLIVAGDGHVEQGLEDPELRGEQSIHGRCWHVGVVADGVDGRRRVPAFEEEHPGRVDHRSAGESGTSLAPSIIGRVPLDSARHESDTNTLELRVILSF